MTTVILEIALATPLRRSFDYLPPADCDSAQLQPGVRLVVPFGRRTQIGLLLTVKSRSDLDLQQLKPALEVLDPAPVVDSAIMALCRWGAAYYLYPLGETLFYALPPVLRKGKRDEANSQRSWRLSQRGLGLAADAFKRAPRQQQVLDYLLQHTAIHPPELEVAGISRAALRTLVKKEMVEEFESAADLDISVRAGRPGPQPGAEQRAAIEGISEGMGSFHPCLLEGVTGSGKTEVYLQAIAEVLSNGGQALVLVPEIGLTPQTIARFEQRFPARVVAMHSGLSDGERLQAWRAAAKGHASVVIGTRSAVFARFRSLRLIVVDEEHDASYKQQEGFRFSGRDVAVKRAQMEAIPIVLGSATPCAESLHNALSGRYQSLRLQQRAGKAQAPGYQLLDLRGQALQEGFCEELLAAIQHTIGAGNQVLVFLNRRGFAPALICHACGWVAACAHCDARMVVHRRSRLLKCHHCEAQSELPSRCLACDSPQLIGVGQGTERSEAFLQSQFATTPVLRIDRDTTRHKGAMDDFMERIHSGRPAILIGTQMLAKGHHFPKVTLVAILDADAGLCSSDFRGPERTAQMLMQVAGRAGREEQAGRVLIQTHQPDHPLLQLLIQDRYRGISEHILTERRLLQLPPFGFLGVVRCEAGDPQRAEQLLVKLREVLQGGGELTLIGPLAPPIARRAGRYRFQLLLKHPRRGPLHRALGQAVEWLDKHPRTSSLRWSVDVDPQDFI